MFATIDFLPTFARLCDFDVPAARRIDGIDQTDLLRGKRETGREHFYFHNAGVRLGKWKFLKSDAFFHGYAKDDDRPNADELYDLEADLGERANLASSHPGRIEEMRALMKSIEAGDRLEAEANLR